MTAVNANVWNPQSLLQLSANTKRIEQRFTALAGQTLFTLTDFTYALSTGSLAVFKNDSTDTNDNGAGLLAEGVEWAEVTTSTFSLVTPATAGDQIIAVGYVGVTAAIDVRDTDIYIASNQALRDYAGSETTVYVQANTVVGDGEAGFFQKRTGGGVGFYVDDDEFIIVPTGGDGAVGWLRQAAPRSVAAMRLAHMAGSISNTTLGYYTVGDGGAGFYREDAADTSTADDGFLVIVAADGTRMKLVVPNRTKINVKLAGAKGDASTDDYLPIKAVIDYAYTLFIANTGLPGGIALDAVPAALFPPANYICGTVIDIGSNTALNLATEGKAAISGVGVTANGFITGIACRNLDVGDIQFENFSTVFALSTGNADSSMYNFHGGGNADVLIFLDSLTQATSRSTICNFYNHKSATGTHQLTKVYFDQLNLINCWFQSDRNMTDFIYANSYITVTGCKFVGGGLVGDTKAGQSWVYWTNDDGAAGVTTEQQKNVCFTNCAFTSDPAGYVTALVADYPVQGSTSGTPTVSFVGCNIEGTKNSNSIYKAGNTEGGVVYLKQYPANISFTACSLHGAFGNPESRLVAREDALTVASAPTQFGIDLDATSYRGLQRSIGQNSNFTMGSLASFVNNIDPATFRGLLENNHLDVTEPIQTEGKVTVISYAGLTGDTVRIAGPSIIDTTVTEGVEWTAATDNSTTATSLAAALSVIANVTAVAVGTTITITADVGTITTLIISDSTNMSVFAPYGIQISSFKVAGQPAGQNHLPVVFWLVLCGLSDVAGSGTAYAGTSVYCCTVNGVSSGGNKARITSTLVHEDAGGYGNGSSSSLLSLHFGTATTGVNTVAVATEYDVTVTWGSALDNGIGYGTARLIPMMQFHNKNSGQPF